MNVSCSLSKTMERTKAAIISPGAVIAVIEAMTFHFHICWPSFSTACCVFNQYALGTSVHYRKCVINQDAQCVLWGGTNRRSFLFACFIVLIKTWDHLEGFNVLKVRATYILERPPWLWLSDYVLSFFLVSRSDSC